MQADPVAELRFGQPLVFARVNQKAAFLNDLFHGKLLVGDRSYFIAHAKPNAFQGRLIRSIDARFAGRFELDFHPAIAGAQDGPQSELGLGLTDPPLTGNE